MNRAVAAPSPSFSARKVSQFSNFNLGFTCCFGHLQAQVVASNRLHRVDAPRQLLRSRLWRLRTSSNAGRVRCWLSESLTREMRGSLLILLVPQRQLQICTGCLGRACSARYATLSGIFEAAEASAGGCPSSPPEATPPPLPPLAGGPRAPPKLTERGGT
eukprot:COSAG02_NODE_13536_length_1382_cov_1.289945_3_plen_159_part_01